MLRLASRAIAQWVSMALLPPILMRALSAPLHGRAGCASILKLSPHYSCRNTLAFESPFVYSKSSRRQASILLTATCPGPARIRPNPDSTDSTRREVPTMPSLRVFVPVLLLASVTGQAAEKPFGLEKRVPWNDSRVVGSPDPPPPYKTTRAFPKLTVKQPLSLTPEPGTNRLFMLRHHNVWAGPGHLLAIDDDQNASHVEDLLEIDGLPYGVAFHPDYERNGYIYIGLSGPLNGRKATQVRRYTVDRRPPHRIDPKSKLIIIDWASNGHDGGDLTFGNDGYLYVSSGDGSSGSDAHLTGQRIDDLLAAVLRIDVDHPSPGRNYGVPKDNPFVDRKGARPELWAYGLRNPWRTELRPRVGAALGRPERAGPVGAGLPDPEGCQLRLERQRGEPHLPRHAPGWPRPDRAADRRAPPQRGPLDHRRQSLPRHPLARAGGGLRLRRLVHRPRLGDQARWHEGDLAPRAGRYTLQHHRLRHRPRRRAVRDRPVRAGSIASSRRPRPTGPRGRSRPG